jgi:predicted enzyme related to lactoylglutathione lyase
VEAICSTDIIGHIFLLGFVMSMKPGSGVSLGAEFAAPSYRKESLQMSFPSLIVMPVSNVETAKATYRALLGVDPYVDQPYYIGFKTEGGEIGLDPNGKIGPLAYWDVDDLDDVVDKLTAAGATVTQEPADVGGGLMIAVLADADGNPIGLRQAG